MASSKTLILICLNLALFTLVSSNYVPTPSTPPPPPPYYEGGGYPTPATPTGGNCPVDTLKLAACVDVLHGSLLHLLIGQARTTQCCSLVGDLVGLDAALCLCTNLKVAVLGLINLDIPISLSVLLNVCHKTPGVPQGFQCPN